MNKPLKQIEGIMTMFGEQRHLDEPSTVNIWRGNHFVLLLEKAGSQSQEICRTLCKW